MRLVLALLIVLWPGLVLAAPVRPNIVIIMGDDHGSNAIGAYGRTVAKTPNLDRLAREGTRFDRAFSTVASCSPSRAALLSGRYAHSNGMYGLAHEPSNSRSFTNVVSLSSRMKSAGYRTGRLGKFHVAPDSVYPFDDALNGDKADDYIGRRPEEIAERVERFIRASAQPFFLYVATTDPHRDTEKTAPGQPNRFGNRDDGYPGVTEVRSTPDAVAVPSWLPDTAATRRELVEYYQAASRLDHGVGHIIRILEATGQLSNTVIMYLSDNGPAFPNAKTTLYDSGIRLPLIVRAPGIRDAGSVRQSMVSWIDIAPTVLDYAQAPQPAGALQGRSFKPVLEQGDQPGWDRIFASHITHEAHMYYPMRVVRTNRYKLIWNIAAPLAFPMARDLQQSLTWRDLLQRNGKFLGKRSVSAFLNRPTFELYDMKADPDEIVNLASQPRHAATLAALKSELKEFQRRTNDPWIVKWDYE